MIAGPLVGGLFVDLLSWRLAFLINVVPIAITLWLLTRIEHRDIRRPDASIDWLGAAMCTFGLGAAVFALIEQPNQGWTSPATWIPLLGGIALFAGFLLRQRTVKNPILPLDLFRVRNFSAGNAATLFIYGALSLNGFVVGVYLQQGAGLSATAAGLASLPTTILLILLSSRAGTLAGKWGPRLFMTFGPLTMAVGALLLLMVSEDFSYWWQVLPSMILMGIGLGADRVAAHRGGARRDRHRALGHRVGRQQRRLPRRRTARDRARWPPSSAVRSTSTGSTGRRSSRRDSWPPAGSSRSSASAIGHPSTPCPSRPGGAPSTACQTGRMSVIENSKLTVVGAGSVGASVAYAALIRGSARHVALYDIATAKVEAEVLDLAHGTQFTGASDIIGGSDISVVEGSHIVVITAGAKQNPGQSRIELAGVNAGIIAKMMPQLLEVAPNAVYVLVTNPCDVLTVLAAEASGLPRERIFSSGTVLDTSRLRWKLGERAGVSHQQRARVHRRASTATPSSRSGRRPRSAPSRSSSGRARGTRA